MLSGREGVVVTKCSKVVSMQKRGIVLLNTSCTLWI